MTEFSYIAGADQRGSHLLQLLRASANRTRHTLSRDSAAHFMGQSGFHWTVVWRFVYGEWETQWVLRRMCLCLCHPVDKCLQQPTKTHKMWGTRFWCAEIIKYIEHKKISHVFCPGHSLDPYRMSAISRAHSSHGTQPSPSDVAALDSPDLCTRIIAAANQRRTDYGRQWLLTEIVTVCRASCANTHEAHRSTQKRQLIANEIKTAANSWKPNDNTTPEPGIFGLIFL